MPPLTPEEKDAHRDRLWKKRIAFELGIGLHLNPPPLGPRLSYHWRAMVLAVFLRCTGLYWWGKRHALKPVLREVTFRYPDLPQGLRGFRILHLTDLHFIRGDRSQAEAAATLVKGLHVDLCAITGDYVFGLYGPQDHVTGALELILHGVRSTHGVYATLGNHDSSITVEQVRAAGARVLINEGERIAHQDAELWVGGVDDPRKYQSDSVAISMAGSPEAAFRVLLAHSPERIEQALEHGVQLYLSGHSHGGQFRLPFGPALHLNVDCHPRFADGPWFEKGLHGYTSRGLGTTYVPVRFFCPPEAVLITLEQGSPE